MTNLHFAELLLRWLFRLGVLKDETNYIWNIEIYCRIRTGDRATICVCRLYKLSMVVFCVHMLQLCALQHRRTHEQNLVWINFAHAEAFAAPLNLWLLLFCLASIYFTVLMYETDLGLLVPVILDLLGPRRNHVFYWTNFPKTRQTPKQSGWYLSLAIFRVLAWLRSKLAPNFDRNVQRHIRTVAIRIMNLMRVLYLFIVFRWLSFLTLAYDDFAGRDRFSSPNGRLHFVALLLMWSVTLVVALGIARAWVVYGTCALLSSYLGHLKLREHQRFTRTFFRRSRRRFRAAPFHYHREEMAFYLYCMHDMSRVFGSGFVAFLLVCLPSNAVLCINFLVVGNRLKSSDFELIALLTGVIQLVVIFAVHLYLCSLTYQLGVSSKWSLSWLPHMRSNDDTHARRAVPLRLRLQLADYVQRYYTRRPYSLTYGRFGQITYGSVRLCATQYWRLLVFAFKFWHG